MQVTQETRIQPLGREDPLEKETATHSCILAWVIDYAKAFDWVDHNKLWKILKEMGIQPLGREDPLE